MWSFITSSIILFALSILILFLVHHLIEYLKTTYTTKKTKDIVGIQMQKYKMMVDDMYEKERQRWIANTSSHNLVSTPNPIELTQQELQSVNNDLDEFVKQLI